MAVYAEAFIAAAAAIVVFILEIKYKRHHQEKSAARVEKAKALGHVVKAKLKKDYYRDRLRHHQKNCEAIYTYEVDGKEYRYDYLEPKVPPAQINLYYIDNPKKAFWDGSKTMGQKSARLIYYLLPAITFVLVTLILTHILG